MLIGEHLRLHVARPIQVALHKALAATKRSHRFPDRGVIQLRDFFQRAGDLQAAAAATEGSLDCDRQTVFLGESNHLVGGLNRIGGARHLGRASAGGDVSRRNLVAEIANRLWRRADPGQTGVDHCLGELGVLRQEPIARVHRVGTRLGGSGDDLVDDQV